MNRVWLCRARQRGRVFPSLTGKYAGIELLNWQVSGTVLLSGRAELVASWAAEQGYTKPQPPLPGLYLVDAETVYPVDARGALVTSAAEVVRSLSTSPRTAGRLTEQQACEVLVEQQRVFVLSDLNSFQIASLLLQLFGIRSRPADTLRLR